MAVFKCKMCGGDLEIIEGRSVAECQYCGSVQTLPKLDDEKRANLYDRANHFRRNNEYDKALAIYEQILNEEPTDAEAYWSVVLCKYGIEYVEDPKTHKRIPTVNRAQFTSVSADEDFKSALKYADAEQKKIYKAEAKTIDDIQKGILEISQKEDPFDVFICYKETDNNGRRTPDSVLATELYHELVKEGFKVFFSRITLEDKLGQEYEPYIFAALNSSKVMVVLGTKSESFNAVWVRNEWSRFLALIKNGKKKTLIPAYRDMDPYDLPEEFSHLQAQDMSKLGFMQDLICGIKKILEVEVPAPIVKETVVMQNESGNVQALLDRGFMALEDSEWEKADAFFEQALNFDAKLSQAYLGKLLAEFKVKNIDELSKCPQFKNDNSNYKKLKKFGDDSIQQQLNNILENAKTINKKKKKKHIIVFCVLLVTVLTALGSLLFGIIVPRELQKHEIKENIIGKTLNVHCSNDYATFCHFIDDSHAVINNDPWYEYENERDLSKNYKIIIVSSEDINVKIGDTLYKLYVVQNVPIYLISEQSIEVR